MPPADSVVSEFEGRCDGNVWCSGRCEKGRALDGSPRGAEITRAVSCRRLASRADGPSGYPGLVCGGVDTGARAALCGGYSGGDLDRRGGRTDTQAGRGMDPRGRRWACGRGSHHARHRYRTRSDRGHGGAGDVCGALDQGGLCSGLRPVSPPYSCPVSTPRARYAPPRMRHLDHLGYYAVAADQLDLAVRNTRVLARDAVTLVRDKGAAPGRLVEAIMGLALAVEALAGYLEQPQSPARCPRVRARGLAGGNSGARDEHRPGDQRARRPDPLDGHRSAASRRHGLRQSPQSTRGGFTPRVEGVTVVGVPRTQHRLY